VRGLSPVLAYVALVVAVTVVAALALAALGLGAETVVAAGASGGPTGSGDPASGSAAAPPALAAAAGNEPVARAVLFYSPTCAHCRDLIQNGLPPILRDYGDQLRLLAVDASVEPGTSLFRAAVERYDVPASRRGVPALVIGAGFLTGTSGITERLPSLVARSLRAGGAGWPDLPGLAALAASPGATTAGSSPGGLLAATERPDGVLDRLARDRWGNTAALVLLAGMAAALGLVVVRMAGRRRAPAAGLSRGRTAATGALIAAGLGVAGYLSWAAATGSGVLCGPLASCDVVQGSSYARLLGVPVAYLGLVGYALIAAAFLTSVLAGGRAARLAGVALLALTLAGTAFSLYLTVLEPFVLGAACLWCLASAAVMTLLLLLSAERLGLVGRRAEAEASERMPRPSAGRGDTHARSHAG